MKKILFLIISILLIGEVTFAEFRFGTQGSNLTFNDNRYVNLSGDTMTGTLTSSATSALSATGTIKTTGTASIGTTETAATLTVAGSLEFRTQAYSVEINDGNSGTADTIDWTTGNNHLSTVNGACTYTFTAPTGPAHLTLRMVSTGGGTPTFPGAVKWASGTAPTWTTTEAAVNLAFFYYNNSVYYGSSILDAK